MVYLSSAYGLLIEFIEAPLMARIIDLSMPIVDHFRWPVERRLNSDHARGDLFQVTWQGFAVHGFTHMDSPRHFFADGRTTSDIPLETTVGEAAVVDLTPVEPNQAITAERLAAAASHVERGEIVVLRSCWEQQRSPKTPEFWTEAPYVARDAAEWLLGAKAPGGRVRLPAGLHDPASAQGRNPAG